ncbi:MAG: hypothetical protein ABMA25_01660, partial [Ilumatobacteraceae bacterium]
MPTAAGVLARSAKTGIKMSGCSDDVKTCHAPMSVTTIARASARSRSSGKNPWIAAAKNAMASSTFSPRIAMTLAPADNHPFVDST